MTQPAYKDSELLADLRNAVLENWASFLIKAGLIAFGFFSTLHVGVKLGYALAYFELRSYTPGSLQGNALTISNQLLTIAIAALILVGVIELFRYVRE